MNAKLKWVCIEIEKFRKRYIVLDKNNINYGGV